ncbi:hypothetical protein [Aliikangiella coralliicola]|uniref:Uncharacterized protein n=1 Tax=Aliikangiella coralliicola TaxID=2592383 RepID=A0A545U6H8_9GAMM|nr:hypothetical protein [Aliikangiella coralliicola]TQV85067.1 hypothetical protein FLL46_22015 [Aliikangiella coralliicola]
MKIMGVKNLMFAVCLLSAIASFEILASTHNPSFSSGRAFLDISEIEDFCNWDGVSYPQGIGKWRHCVSIKNYRPFAPIGSEPEPTNLMDVSYYYIVILGPQAPDPKPKGGYDTK